MAVLPEGRKPLTDQDMIILLRRIAKNFEQNSSEPKKTNRLNTIAKEI